MVNGLARLYHKSGEYMYEGCFKENRAKGFCRRITGGREVNWL